VSSTAAAATSTPDHIRDLEAAVRASAAIRDRGTGRLTPDAPAAPGIPQGFLQFSGQVNFFTTIAYLTQDQADNLLKWYLASGMFKLPVIPGPDTGPDPKMYEILQTAIHFGTPKAVHDLSAEELEGADIGDFFSGLAHAVGGLIGNVLDSVGDVLDSATNMLHAATELVHEVHDLVVLAE
jgi:hypothetical protein